MPKKASMVKKGLKTAPIAVSFASRTLRHECAQCSELRPCGWKVGRGGYVRWLCSICGCRG